MTAVTELRPGVRRRFLVQRRVRLARASLALLQQQSTLIPELVQQAAALLGFNHLQQRHQSLWLEYDAAYLQLDALLALLEQAGIHPAGSRWNRIRLDWYRYQDANIRDNARHTDRSSCSQSPLRHR